MYSISPPLLLNTLHHQNIIQYYSYPSNNYVIISPSLIILTDGHIKSQQGHGATLVGTTTTATPRTPPCPAIKNRLSSPTYMLFNMMDDLVNTFVDPPRHPSVDPKHVLSNNFAPVDELPPTEVPIIEGTLPACLDGAYIRNGPNPHYVPKGPYHLFDGDGMLHCLRISKRRATLCSRYVKTYKYMIEHEAGSPVIPNVCAGFRSLLAIAARGTLAAFRVLSGQVDPIKGTGLANTSVAYFGNKLFALGESDLPYQIHISSDGDIETIGRHDFDGNFSSRSSMTAHPKTDAQTGETFAFRYSLMPPFLTYFRFDANGRKLPDIPIYSLSTPTFLHDFAITKKYVVFADIQFGMTTNLMKLISGGGSILGADLQKVPRLGVMPRYANDESEIKWFDVPGFNFIHAINAWDEDDSVVLIAPNVLPIQHILNRMDLILATVEVVRIDLKNGTVSRSSTSTKNLDLGVINPEFVGRKNKYGYMAIGDPMPKISGVVKLEWSSKGGKEVGCRMFGDQCYGGEPFFVGNTEGEEEDDGYLVSYVHNEISGESRFLVMDAKPPTLDIVASVKLPQRVPYGFHGLFVKESDLKKV